MCPISKLCNEVDSEKLVPKSVEILSSYSFQFPTKHCHTLYTNFLFTTYPKLIATFTLKLALNLCILTPFLPLTCMTKSISDVV